MVTQTVNKPGQAYAFFDSDATEKEIKGAMSDIRESAQTPQGLELLLHKNPSKLKMDGKLKQMVSAPKDSRILHSGVGVDSPEVKPLEDLGYVLEANYPGATNEETTNEETAGELGDMMNYVSYLNASNLSFNGRVIYENNGDYCSRN